MKLQFMGLATVLVACAGCHIDSANLMQDGIIDKGGYHAPPAAMLERPGPMVDGPGPGVLQTAYMASSMPQMGVVPGVVPPGVLPVVPFNGLTTQIRFVGPEAMQIGWQIEPHRYAENQLTAPGRYNFNQGYIHKWFYFQLTLL